MFFASFYYQYYFIYEIFNHRNFLGLRSQERRQEDTEPLFGTAFTDPEKKC